jgi:hypothetical protein
MSDKTNRVIATFDPLKVERLNNGNIRLEQDQGHGEAAVVDLHPLQARFIGSLVSTYQDPDKEAQNAVKRLALQVRILHEQIDVVVSGLWQSERFVEDGSNDFLLAQASELRTLADSYLEMLGTEPLCQTVTANPQTEAVSKTDTTGDLFASTDQPTTKGGQA